VEDAQKRGRAKLKDKPEKGEGEKKDRKKKDIEENSMGSFTPEKISLWRKKSMIQQEERKVKKKSGKTEGRKFKVHRESQKNLLGTIDVHKPKRGRKKRKRLKFS